MCFQTFTDIPKADILLVIRCSRPFAGSVGHRLVLGRGEEKERQPLLQWDLCRPDLIRSGRRRALAAECSPPKGGSTPPQEPGGARITAYII